MTLEFLVERWEDQRTIKNLICKLPAAESAGRNL